MKTYPEIEPLVDRILPRLVALRHRIHEKPELALMEHDTSSLVRAVISETDVEIFKPFMETDVVALLRQGGKARNITLRADMDALPLSEKTGLSYASKNEGVMHACGHDGHTAMLVGAVLVLNELRAYIDGSVRFIFQPGEEVVAAARDLVSRGVLNGPEPDAVVALHAWPGIRTGCISSRSGPMMASADFFKVTVKGKGGHGSKPNEAVNPITTGARIVEMFGDIVATTSSSFEPVVVSVCRFQGGSNSNVIPDTVEIEGTVRYFSSKIKDKIVESMKRAVKGICDAAGASHDFIYENPYMPTVNDESIVSFGRQVVNGVIGRSMWHDAETPSMGAEDFSYYISHYPGAMFHLGMGEDYPPLHNPYFDFNDDALKSGILFLCSMALGFLSD